MVLNCPAPKVNFGSKAIALCARRVKTIYCRGNISGRSIIGQGILLVGNAEGRSGGASAEIKAGKRKRLFARAKFRTSAAVYTAHPSLCREQIFKREGFMSQDQTPFLTSRMEMSSFTVIWINSIVPIRNFCYKDRRESR